MQSANKLIKTAGFMVIATMAAKICGLLRDSFIAAYFGTGAQTDAYFAATKIPLLFFDIIIGGVISAAFIPVFNEYLQKDTKKRAFEFANRFINAILLITALICVIGIVFSSSLIDLITPGLSEATKEYAVLLSNIMFPMIIFTGLAFSFVGILQSFGEFTIPAIISLVSNGVMIAYLLIFKNRFGVTGLAIAMLVGWAMQAIVQIPSLIKFKFTYRPDFHFADEGLKKTAILAIPLLISTWVQPFGTLINMYFASSLGEGTMAALEFANKLYIIIVGVFSFVVTNLVFPSLSRANAAGNKDESLTLIKGSLKSVSLIILPLMAGVIILAKPIVAIIYQHGEFDAASTALTSAALMFYSFGMIGYSYSEVLNKSFFAMQDSKTPMMTALISIVCNVFFSYILSKLLGMSGLALGSAIAASINALLNIILMNKRVKNLFSKKDIIDIAKLLISTVIMGISVYFVYNITQNYTADNFIGWTISALIPAFVGIAVYFIMCVFFKVEEIAFVKNLFKK